MFYNIVDKEQLAELLLAESYKVTIVGGGLGVEPRGLHNILNITKLIKNEGTRGTNGLGHVSTHYWLQMTRLNTRLDNHHPIKIRHIIKLPHHHDGNPAMWSYGLYGQVQSASQIFVYLARRTDRDISSIRTLFAKVNIPPESGRQDEHNDTVFVTFRAL
jgi:hypothetical protein